MMGTPLTEKKEGVIFRFTNEEMSAKFLAMGILPGERIRILRRAPFRGAYFCEVNGRRFGLRQFEARCIEVF